MQTTTTRTAGSHTDLLTGILNVHVRNEDKITEQDRQYCQLQQDQLYRTLDRIDRWYDILTDCRLFRIDAERGSTYFIQSVVYVSCRNTFSTRPSG